MVYVHPLRFLDIRRDKTRGDTDVQGAYAEYITVPEGMILAKPKEISWVEAAALPENWMTGTSIHTSSLPQF